MADRKTTSPSETSNSSSASSKVSAPSYSVTAGGRVVVDTAKLAQTSSFREVGRLAALIVERSKAAK